MQFTDYKIKIFISKHTGSYIIKVYTGPAQGKYFQVDQAPAVCRLVEQGNFKSFWTWHGDGDHRLIYRGWFTECSIFYPSAVDKIRRVLYGG